MSTKEAQTQLNFKNDQHAVLAIPEIQQLIQVFRPGLLDNSETSKWILDQMESYLSTSNSIQCDQMEAIFTRRKFLPLCMV